MLAKGKYNYYQRSASNKLYFCKHCKKNLSYKTYLRHVKLFLKQEKASTTVDLPSLESDTSSEEGRYLPTIIIYNTSQLHS